MPKGTGELTQRDVKLCLHCGYAVVWVPGDMVWVRMVATTPDQLIACYRSPVGSHVA